MPLVAAVPVPVVVVVVALPPVSDAPLTLTRMAAISAFVAPTPLIEYRF
ncbi:hypothetical protein [Salmonirosea aquatica]